MFPGPKRLIAAQSAQETVTPQANQARPDCNRLRTNNDRIRAFNLMAMW